MPLIGFLGRGLQQGCFLDQLILEWFPPSDSCGQRLNDHGLLPFPSYFPFRFLKSRTDSFDHPPKPVEIQDTQNSCAGKIRKCQPWRNRKLSRGFKSKPNVLIHLDRLVRPPNQSTSSKGGNEGNTIDQLGLASRHTQFVHEPMKIKEGRGELVENEIQAIIVHEGSLRFVSTFQHPRGFRHRRGIEETHESQRGYC